MILTDAPTPRQQLVGDLMAKIRSGELLPGDKLLPTARLAAAYGLSVPTAHKAVRELVEAGYVDRTTGLGTFVRRDLASAKPICVGLLIPYEQHLWDGLSRQLLRGLCDHPLTPVLINPEGRDPAEVSVLPAYRQLVAARPAVVVSATRHLQKMVFADLPDSLHISLEPTSTPGIVQVLPDYCAIGELSARHVLERGYREADYLGIDIGAGGASGQMWSNQLIEQSLRSAMTEGGGRVRHSVYLRHSTDGSGELAAWLASPGRAPVLVSSQGHRAVQVWRLAMQLGLRVPEDIAILSAIDTPLTAEFGISSVDHRFDRIAATCLRLIVGCLHRQPAPEESLVYQVLPVMRPRGSTCGA